MTKLLPSRRQASCALAILCLFAVAASAQPMRHEDIPPELRGWTAWVLDGVPEHACPTRDGRALCLWPARLSLDLGESGGRFRQEVRADRMLAFALPGGRESWPQDVAIDGRVAAVVENEGAPTLRLPAGDHVVTGRFEWSQMPDSLPVPQQIALVSLRVDDALVAFPSREQGGLLWLRRSGASAAGEADRLSVQVFRKVQDGIPLFVETSLLLDVSGKAREAVLVGAALPATEPVAVWGTLPVQLDDDGRLRVQVRSGRHTVSLLARVTGRGERLAVPHHDTPWPGAETWVFEANERLRHARVSGGQAIDASRTDLPEAWRAYPAVTLAPGEALTIETVTRGEPQADPDRVTLAREMWLDLDGRGMTVRDTFSGAFGATSRLDLLPPGRLGRAQVNGNDELVTSLAGDDPPSGGVELRHRDANVVAEARRPRTATMTAVGWELDVERLSLRLHLPPGWVLLATTGADATHGSWLSRWSLVSAFFLLLVALATQRLFGWRVALLVLGTLGLTYHEPGAPRWLWVALLLLVAWHARQPMGPMRRATRAAWWVSVGLLAVTLVPFVRDQVLQAMVSHVAPAYSSPVGFFQGADGAFQAASKAPAMVPQVAEPPRRAMPATPGFEAPTETDAQVLSDETREELATLGYVEEDQEVEQRLDESVRWQRGSRTKMAHDVASNLMQDPHSVLQTGPGLPRWSLREARLDWSGPVASQQRVRLVLLSPWGNALFALARVALVLALAAWLLGLRRWPFARRTPATGVATGILIGVTFLAGAKPAAAADVPPSGLLEELKNRLTRPPACGTQCVDTPRMIVEADSTSMTIEAEVHAQAAGTWAAPGPVASWLPSEILMDGRVATAVVRLEDGFLHLRLEPGVHRVELRGPLSSADSLTLQLKDRPRRAEARSSAWEIAGVRPDGPPDASIQLSRKLRGGVTSSQSGSSPLSSWLEVERRLEIGVSWRVHTTVRRVGPAGVPVAVRVPLIEGEALTQGEWLVEKGAVALSLARDQAEARWVSTLEPRETLILTAPEQPQWSEVWRLSCGVVWRCSHEGIPPVSRVRDGVMEPELRPWPGETVTLTFTRPRGVPGATLTVDHAALSATPQARQEIVELDLSARASREETLVVTLPEGADVKELRVGDAARPIRPEDGRLALSLGPGSSAVHVRWQQDRGMGMWYRTPRVSLSTPATNVTTQVSLDPAKRFVLFTGGPDWGPVVLVWFEVLVMIGLAVALGRLGRSPLRWHQWLILGLGLTQVPFPLALVVLALPLGLAWRARRSAMPRRVGIVVQTALVAWTGVALLIVFVVVMGGLMAAPEMNVTGNASTAGDLRWYVDRTEGAVPVASVVSLPVWVFRGAVVAWALWLAAGLVGATRWGWSAFTSGGLLPKADTAEAPAADTDSPTPAQEAPNE